MAPSLWGSVRAWSFGAMASWLLVLGGCHTPEGVARARAANDFHCDEDKIEIEELGGTSYRATGCGESETYNCSGSVVGGTSNGYGGGTTNYVCLREASSASTSTDSDTETEPSRPSASSTAASKGATSTEARKPVAAPTGVAGFTFGSTVEATQAACEAKYAWTPSGADVFECSGTPKTIGTSARAMLKFCAGSLCKAVFVARPESDQSSEWLRQFVALKVGLIGKYGEPVEDKAVPNSCGNDILPCVRSGTAHVKYTWTFPSGTFIVLVLSNTPGPDAVIRLTYARGEPTETPAL